MENYSDFEKTYYPSFWIKRDLTRDELIKIHLNLTKNNTPNITEKVPCQLSVPYDEGERDTYDIFGTDLEEADVLVFVHGGYWQLPQITKEAYHYLAEAFHHKNIKTIFIEYEICPKISLEKMVEKVEIATRQCLKYAVQTNARSVHLMGHSAGGHLISSLFKHLIPSLPSIQSNLIKSVFLLSGIYDLVPLLQTKLNDPLKLNEESAKSLSPIYFDIPKSSIKFYVIVGEFEAPGLRKQAEIFFDYLKKLEANVSFVDLKGVDHFDMLEKLWGKGYELNQIIYNEIKYGN